MRTVKTIPPSTQGKAVRGRCVSNWSYLRSRRTQKPASSPSSRCHMKSTGTTRCRPPGIFNLDELDEPVHGESDERQPVECSAAPPIISDGEKGPACLIVTASGNERRVRSLNLPELGQSLTFEPLTSTEREMFAKAGQIDTVPVIIARK